MLQTQTSVLSLQFVRQQQQQQQRQRRANGNVAALCRRRRQSKRRTGGQTVRKAVRLFPPFSLFGRFHCLYCSLALRALPPPPPPPSLLLSLSLTLPLLPLPMDAECEYKRQSERSRTNERNTEREKRTIPRARTLRCALIAGGDGGASELKKQFARLCNLPLSQSCSRSFGLT